MVNCSPSGSSLTRSLSFFAETVVFPGEEISPGTEERAISDSRSVAVILTPLSENSIKTLARIGRVWRFSTTPKTLDRAPARSSLSSFASINWLGFWLDFYNLLRGMEALFLAL